VPLQPEELLTSAHISPRTAQSPAQVRRDLAAEVLQRFGELRFLARGSSMIPSIYPGDLLTVRSHSIAGARLGQIILYLREDRFWAHRIIRKWQEGNRFLLTTRGDALSKEDPSVDESHFLGCVTSVVRYGRLIDVTRVESLWVRLIRLGVRNSGTLAKALLRRHSLRLRLLGNANHSLGSAPMQVLECL
jgi:hypothetical protein